VTPPAGVAAEGHRPGAANPTAAEHENSQQFWLTTWIATWLALGSSAGAADAHPLETDSTGLGRVAQWWVQAMSAKPWSLFVQAPPGAGFAIAATGGSLFGDATISTTSTGPGPALEAASTTAGYGILVTKSGSGAGQRINHSGSGIGLDVNYTGTNGAVVVVGGASVQAMTVTGGVGQLAIGGVSGNNATAAIGGLGVGTAAGVDGQGGNTSAAPGTRGSAAHPSAPGVHGRTAVAPGSGTGVLGEGRGTGQVGVTGLSLSGPAFLFQGDSSSPLYPLGRFVPQDADPTASTNTGDFTLGVQNQLRYCVAGFGYKPVLSLPTTGSACYAIASQLANATVNYGSSFVAVLTASCLASQGNGFYSSALAHRVRVRFIADVRTGVAAADYANVRFVDVTGGGAVTIFTWSGAGTAANAGFALPVATTDWQRVVVADLTYSPLTDGDLEVRVEMSRVTNNQFVRNGRLEIIGSVS
jgi:hypothetical protein